MKDYRPVGLDIMIGMALTGFVILATAIIMGLLL